MAFRFRQFIVNNKMEIGGCCGNCVFQKRSSDVRESGDAILSHREFDDIWVKVKETKPEKPKRPRPNWQLPLVNTIAAFTGHRQAFPGRDGKSSSSDSMSPCSHIT
ncbi:hypothetical protein HAX54_037418 [Datura stramonium]|uniref:Uncharacterized protein n=1 Tax=Datura stramonium TaxID=4076 RepID=A0ABS8SGV8_DATST|nr:hypothetical protein [Datura stramonium]